MSSGSVYRRRNCDSTASDEDSEISFRDTEKSHQVTNLRVFGRNRKKSFLLRFRNFRKFFKLSPSSTSPSDSPPNSDRFGKSRFGNGGLCCCACVSKPYVNNDDDSQRNLVRDDPEKFSYEHLKSMIERNDFYSKEYDSRFDD